MWCVNVCPRLYLSKFWHDYNLLTTYFIFIRLVCSNEDGAGLTPKAAPSNNLA